MEHTFSTYIYAKCYTYVCAYVCTLHTVVYIDILEDKPGNTLL